MWGGNSATHASPLFSICSGKKVGGCSQLVLSVALTFLQLHHQVIVLKESVIAECVREQHLDDNKKKRDMNPETNWIEI